jgi:hypothetical protein
MTVYVLAATIVVQRFFQQRSSGVGNAILSHLLLLVIDITPSAHKGQKKTSGPISGLGIRGTISCETDNMNP